MCFVCGLSCDVANVVVVCFVCAFLCDVVWFVLGGCCLCLSVRVCVCLDVLCLWMLWLVV